MTKKTNSYGIKTRLVRRTDNNQLFSAYRPMRFSEFYGPTISAAGVLANSLIKNDRKLAQKAWLISGPPSTGKTTMAILMALSMNCLNPEPYGKDKHLIEPCLQCASCKGILDRGLLSRHQAFLYYNVASLKKEDIVDIIRRDMASGSSLEGRHKVIVFEEAHNLTKQQKEALLKPVENTLSKVYLVFATTEPGKLTSNRAMKGRLTPLTIGHWQKEDMVSVLKDIAQQEYDSNRAPFLEVKAISRIVDMSDSDIRIAISNLQLVLDGISPRKDGIIHVEDVIPVLGEPVEYSDDFRKYFYAILQSNHMEAITILDNRFDRVVGIDARSVAVATVKYLRRVAYSEVKKRNRKNAIRILRQLHAFNSAFWQQIADDFTALTIATFAALEAGMKPINK